jgi:two-component system, sporulation sensor kinase A
MKEMTPSYNLVLVSLSILIGVIASYCTLDTIDRIKSYQGTKRRLWTILGSVAMGFGIWAMHFIGMLAFHLSMMVAYHLILVFFSLLTSIAFTYFSLLVISKHPIKNGNHILGSLFLGIGVISMHFIGMSSIQVQATIVYHSYSILLSIITAVCAPYFVFWISSSDVRSTFWLKNRIVLASILGLIIASIHYTAMAGTTFIPQVKPLRLLGVYFPKYVLVYSITGSVFYILVIALSGSLLDRRYEKKLQDQRLHTLFNQDLDIIFSLDLDRVFLAVNSTCEAVLGYHAEEIIGKTFHHFISNEELTRIRFDELLIGEKQNIYITALHKSGQDVELKLTLIPMVINRNVVSIFGIARDITEQKQLAERLQLTELELQETIHLQNGMTFKFKLVNNHYIHTMFDGELLYQLGLSPEEVIGKKLGDFLPSDNALSIEDSYRKAWEGECPVTYESELSGINYSVSLRPVIRSGKVVEVIGLGLDITERKRMEKSLQESQERFRQLAENINEVLWIRDIDTDRILYVNPVYEEIWGQSCASLYDNLDYFLDSIFHEDYDRVLTYLNQLITGFPRQEEYRIQKPDGTIRWIRERGFPVYNEMGVVYRITGISEDVTELRIKEELLQKMDKLMIVSDLAAGIAHEIRNPLTTIKGFMNLLKPEIKSRFHDIISCEIENIESIIDQFNMLSKPNVDMHFKRSNLQCLIEEAINKVDYLKTDQSIEFQLTIDSSLPMIDCDQKQIQQVFINVFKNAIEAMPFSGFIQIKAERADCDHILILIQDEGIGIPNERLKKLGEPFYSNREKGIGIGLMVCFKSIENHSGKLFIESEVNKGTVVKIVLPIVSELTTV